MQANNLLQVPSGNLKIFRVCVWKRKKKSLLICSEMRRKFHADSVTHIYAREDVRQVRKVQQPGDNNFVFSGVRPSRAVDRAVERIRAWFAFFFSAVRALCLHRLKSPPTKWTQWLTQQSTYTQLKHAVKAFGTMRKSSKPITFNGMDRKQYFINLLVTFTSLRYTYAL